MMREEIASRGENVHSLNDTHASLNCLKTQLQKHGAGEAHVAATHWRHDMSPVRENAGLLSRVSLLGYSVDPPLQELVRSLHRAGRQIWQAAHCSSARLCTSPGKNWLDSQLPDCGSTY